MINFYGYCGSEKSIFYRLNLKIKLVFEWIVKIFHVHYPVTVDKKRRIINCIVIVLVFSCFCHEMST